MLKANCQIVVRCPPAKQQGVASLPERSWNTFLVRRSIARLLVIPASLAAVTLAASSLFAIAVRRFRASTQSISATFDADKVAAKQKLAARRLRDGRHCDIFQGSDRCRWT